MLDRFSIGNVLNSPSEKSWSQNVNTSLIKLFFLFLPFGRALTIDLGFPLKFSEIFLILFVFTQLITGQIIKWRVNKIIMLIGLLFITVVFASVVINIFYQYPYQLYSYSRFSPVFDTILKFFYIILSFMALIVTIRAFSESDGYIKYFFIGAVLSCIYAWYLVAFSALKLPVFLLPGSDPNIQMAETSIGPIIRTGTFGEGNYMGFFLVVATVLALYYKKPKLTILFIATTFTSFSTTAYVSLLFFVFVYIIIKYRAHKIRLFSILITACFTVFLLVQFNEVFKRALYDKIFGTADTVEDVNATFSKVERLNYTEVALAMAQENPFFGVGPANYALHYNHFNKLPGFERGAKIIPNNIYVEILAEYGGFAFVIFIVLIFMAFESAIRKSPAILISGLVASLVYFFAFPTFTMLFIWVFLGIILSKNKNRLNSENQLQLTETGADS